MSNSKQKQIIAHLIKHGRLDGVVHVCYWVNLTTGNKLSPTFASVDDANKWFNDVIDVYNDTCELLIRTKEGKIFNVKAVIDNTNIISSTKAKKCPFTHEIVGDILTASVLGTDLADARTRLEEFFVIVDWLD
jgi:hypothetical protein